MTRAMRVHRGIAALADGCPMCGPSVRSARHG